MLDLKGMVAALRRAVKTFEERRQAVRTELERLRRERDAIMYAPAARADVKSALSRWVEETGHAYGDRLITNIGELIRQPSSMDGSRRVAQLMSVAQPTKFGGEADARAFDSAFCAILGAQLTEALHAAIDRAQWPEEGLPLAQRKVKLADLDAQIAALQAEENSILDEAQAAGVILQ